MYSLGLKSFTRTNHREMEENMVEEAEVAGDLYLKAGIVESR